MLARQAGTAAPGKHGSRTPLIPDAVFCTLFERAYALVESGKTLLDLRDAIDASAVQRKGRSISTAKIAKKRYLIALGWDGGPRVFNKALGDLRTACYIVLASTSGCRNHELANVQSGTHHRTQDDDGTFYHWMRSRSDKTYTGVHDGAMPR